MQLTALNAFFCCMNEFLTVKIVRETRTKVYRVNTVVLEFNAMVILCYFIYAPNYFKTTIL